MAPLSPQDLEILNEAVERRRRDEDLETALGRVVRKHGENFDRYVQIIGLLRDEARREKVDLERAAKRLIREERG